MCVFNVPLGSCFSLRLFRAVTLLDRSRSVAKVGRVEADTGGLCLKGRDLCTSSLLSDINVSDSELCFANTRVWHPPHDTCTIFFNMI